jgi:hypothetical protein
MANVTFLISKNNVTTKIVDRYKKQNQNQQILTVPCASVQFEYTGGPRYMRSFYLRIPIYAIENDPYL